MEYLFTAYTVIWALLSGYIFVLGRRQSQLKKDLQVLKEWNSEQ
ncbi:CcmD family protein [Cytobacillus sp. FJAT-54145]|uniref:CcmD family protein n=1 Tax=Cytobacillus spartinae TaxID=3299023 RepID=A0ABW6KGH9_9BACI